MKKPSKCEYCGELVKYPFPIHKKCAEIWRRGWDARGQSDYQRALMKLISEDIRNDDSTIIKRTVVANNTESK